MAEELFRKAYRFYGMHAFKARQLYSVIDSKTKAQIFRYAKDFYAYAPLVGYLYNRRAGLDHTKDKETGETYDLTVMAEQVGSISEILSFNYCLIMLLDSEYEPEAEKRVDKAFRNVGKDPADVARFDEYVRGGIDVLYEKLIEGANKDSDEFAARIFDFVSDIEERYNNGLDLDTLLSQYAN